MAWDRNDWIAFILIGTILVISSAVAYWLLIGAPSLDTVFPFTG